MRRLRKRKHPGARRPRERDGHDRAGGRPTRSRRPRCSVPSCRPRACSSRRRNARHFQLHATVRRRGSSSPPVPKRLRGKVDVITIHPPYVAKDELHDLPDEIKDWEPAHTLTDQQRRRPRARPAHRRGGAGLARRRTGWLLMETDPDRARDVRRVMAAGGFRDVRITKGGPDPDHPRDRREASAVTTVAPYGCLAVADHGGDAGDDDDRSRRDVARGRRRLLARDASDRGRTVRRGQRGSILDVPSTSRRRASTLRTMVHEYGGGAYTVRRGAASSSLELRGPAALPAGPRRRSRSRSRRRPTATAAVRRRRASPPTVGCGSASANATTSAPALARRRERARGGADRRVGRAADDRRRPDFYSVPRISPDGIAPLLPRLGPPVDALGRHASCSWRPRRPDGSLGDAGHVAGRDGRGVDLAAGVEPGRRPRLRAATAAAGGTSSACGTGARVSRCTRPRRSSATRPGSSESTVVSRSSRRSDRLRATTVTGARTSAMLDPETASSLDLDLPYDALRGARSSSPTASTRRAHRRARRRSRTRSLWLDFAPRASRGPAVERGRAGGLGVLLRAARDRVPDRRRPDGARALLPARRTRMRRAPTASGRR